MCDDFQPRLKTADLQRLAAQRLEQLQADGHNCHPVVNTSRKLARQFWGSAWMKQLALCESGGMCLTPGRSLLRHGCVLHIETAPCAIRALVSAEDLYEVELQLHPLEDEHLETLSLSCANHIDSLMALLEGKLNAAILEQLCHPENGLLPTPADWRMHCSCADWAEPCPHAAAAIYAAGCLIDADPSLLFTLRGIDPAQLLTTPAPPPPLISADQLSATFGIDIDLP